MRRQWIICLLLAGITLMVYWPLRNYGLVYYDDPLFLDNPEVVSGLNWHSFLWAVSSVAIANWHPVTSLSFVVDHQFFGTNPGAEHLVNIGFHMANAVLLFLVLNRMTGSLWRSAIVAGLFAWHPLRVESVAWISERKDVLCGFFMLLCLWAYSRFVETKSQPSESKSRCRIWYVLTLLALALGLMSKAMLVTVPFLLLLLDFWPLQRIQIQTAGAMSKEARSLFWVQAKDLIWEKWPCFALSALFCAITFTVQRESAAVVSFDRLGLGERINHAVTSYYQYLTKLFWPTRLAVIYPYSSGESFSAQWPDWKVWIIVLLLLAVSVLCLLLLLRKPYLAIGWFWYLGTMVPVIGLVQIGETAMADRYTYIPLIGPVVGLVWLISEKLERGVFRKTLFVSLASILFAALAVLTRQQLQHWRNTASLFAHTIEVTGDNPSAQSGLGIALEHEGRTNEALIHYRIAATLNPTERQIYYNAGNLLMQQGKWKEASEQYFTVVGFDPNDSVSHLILASILPHLDRNAEAVFHLEEALRINPDSADTMNNFAWMLATSKETAIRNGTRAVQLAKRACELTHYQKTIYVGTLAAAYAEAGRFDEAIATAQKACALAESSGEQSSLQKNQELLGFYRAGRPYRETQSR